MAITKKTATPKEAPRKKFTTKELIEVGKFSTRLGMVLYALDSEKEVSINKYRIAQELHNQEWQALNAKIDLIQSDPIKYFKILDTQGDSTFANCKTASPVTSAKDTATADTSAPLNSANLDSILSRVNDVYSQGQGIGDMIYRHNERPYEKRYRY